MEWLQDNVADGTSSSSLLGEWWPLPNIARSWKTAKIPQRIRRVEMPAVAVCLCSLLLARGRVRAPWIKRQLVNSSKLQSQTNLVLWLDLTGNPLLSESLVLRWHEKNSARKEPAPPLALAVLPHRDLHCSVSAPICCSFSSSIFSKACRLNFSRPQPIH